MSTIVRCRANDPANCRFPAHKSLHAPVQEKVVGMKQFFGKSLPASSQVVSFTGSAAALTLHAEKSTLSWNGVKPQWWKKFYDDSVSHPHLPSRPELLDVIDSPAGKLAVVWQPENQEKSEVKKTLDTGIGVSTCYYKSVETGEVLGYVKMASMSDATAEKAFGNDEFTLFRWKSSTTGSSYGLEGDYDSIASHGCRDLTGGALIEKRREVWVQAQKNLGQGFRRADGRYVYSMELGSEYFPDDATVQKDLKKFTRRLNEEAKNYKEFYSNPYVEFSSVKTPLKGQGFGTALYVYTARKLAGNNQVLVASGVQTGDAERTWENFRKHLKNKVDSVELDYNGQKIVSTVLDFRNK